MKLLLFILRVLFFFLGEQMGIWKHLGGIQANDQWKIPADIAIENVNPDRILVDFRGEKIEIPRLFRQRRKYENVVLCLYDPRGHGEDERDEFKDNCRWHLTVALDNAYVIIESIENFKPILGKKIPSAVTMNVIYEGHGWQGGLNYWSYEKFTKQLSSLSTRTDNMIIQLRCCYCGGFWNSAYTTNLQNIRVVSSNSKDGLSKAYSVHLESINPPVFLKVFKVFGIEEHKEMGTFKTFRDLEKWQVVRGGSITVGDTEHSINVHIFYGHGLDLLQIPETTDMGPDDDLFDRYFQNMSSFKPGIFRRNASKLEIATTILELGEDLDYQTLKKLVRKHPKSQILTDAFDMNIDGKKISRFEIEQAKTAKIYVDPENFNKNGEVCGSNSLNVLECREWAKKLGVEFDVTYDYNGPKGCQLNVSDVQTFQGESNTEICAISSPFTMHFYDPIYDLLHHCSKKVTDQGEQFYEIPMCEVYYNIGFDGTDESIAPACKTVTDFNDI